MCHTEAATEGSIQLFHLNNSIAESSPIFKDPKTFWLKCKDVTPISKTYDECFPKDISTKWDQMCLKPNLKNICGQLMGAVVIKIRQTEAFTNLMMISDILKLEYEKSKTYSRDLTGIWQNPLWPGPLSNLRYLYGLTLKINLQIFKSSNFQINNDPAKRKY